MDWQTLATVLPTLASATLYSATQTTFLWAMRRRRAAPPLLSIRPWVSILKPVAGVDDELRENLESFARLDYPAYEILFGIASPGDPAVPVVRAFLAAHPELPARLVWTTPAGPRRGAPPVHNPKVAQLIDLTRAARGSVIVVSDANVRVPSSYLRSLIGDLLRPGVGIVSSLIAGTGERTLGAALENAQLGAAVAPSVVAAHHMVGRPITVGKSMAMRRADLERVGGWESVASVLAEDDVLGQRFHEMGYGVELCLDPIENRNVTTRVGRSVERHARWAKMRRALVPSCFPFEPFTSPLVIATLAAVVTQSDLASRIWLTALGLQFIGALLCFTLLGARRPLLLAALEPLRAAAWIASWALACVSRKVAWRDNAFAIGSGSALTPLDARRGRGAAAVE